MNRMQKRVLTAVVSVSMVSLALACVTASPSISTTPLYRYRMEQTSSKMSFLPTEMNNFTYTTEIGYTLNCGDVWECFNGAWGLSPQCTRLMFYTGRVSCRGTCDTCGSVILCLETCWDSCGFDCQTGRFGLGTCGFGMDTCRWC